jgi:hypothetical protein
MGNSNSEAGVNSGVYAFLLGVGVDSFNPGCSWSGVALTRSGVQVELELALFSNSAIDLITSRRTTKKLHRCPQRWATPTPELTLFYSELEWLTHGVAHL